MKAKQYSLTKWQHLSDKERTDPLFDKEIVERMGSDFYEQVFGPAIQKGYEAGESYEDVRDAIPYEWEP